jgi:hypothetical protein
MATALFTPQSPLGQYSPAAFGDQYGQAASPWSDAQVPSPECGKVLAGTGTPGDISLSQGRSFESLWPANRMDAQSGGRRKNLTRKQRMMYRKNSRKNRVACRKANRKNSRKANRKNSRKANRKDSRKNSRKNSRKQRGGAMAYGTQEGFGTMLEDDMRAAAGVTPIDKAMADLPQFAGSYGTQTAQVGGSRNSRKNNRRNSRNSRKNRKNSRKASRKNRKNNRKQRGGSFGDNASPVNAPANLMPKEMYAYSHQNPQFYNENIINPNFNGPSNSYAKN